MNELENQKNMIDFIKNVMQKRDNIDDINYASDVGKNPLEIMKFINYVGEEETDRINTNKGIVQRLFSDDVFENIKIIGIGLGNYKGIYTPIQNGELVLVGWLSKDTPIILGSVNDYLSDVQDNIPPIKKNEMILSPRKDGDGPVIYFKDDRSILLKAGDCKILLNDNGPIELDCGGSKILVGKEWPSRNIVIEHKYTGETVVFDEDGIKANNYKSEEGNSGITQTITFNGVICTFQNGLLVATNV